MKRITKIMALILAVMMTAVLFAGCGSEAETDTSSVLSSEAPVSSEPEPDPLGDEYTYSFVALRLPAGFTVQEGENENTATPEDTTKGDNIVFSTYSKDDIGQYSQQYLEDGFKELFPGFQKTLSFETFKVDDMDALSYSFQLKEDGVDKVQTVYAFFGETSSVKIIYNSVSGEFDDAFKASAETFSIVK